MDKYLQALVKVHVHVDAGQRVWFKNEQVPVHDVGGVKKIVLPGTKQTLTFDELKRLGARVDVVTLRNLAIQGAEGRWRDEINERRKIGLPSNVYVANARSIKYAQEKGRVPPLPKYVGRQRDQITDVYDTVDEVVQAMTEGKWRTEFTRGRLSRRKKA